MLAVAGDDGDLLAVFAKSVELVLEGSLDLLAGDVGELGFGDQRLCLGADELLLKNDDARGLRVFVLELSDLVGDLLLACSGDLVNGSNLRSRVEGILRSRLGCTEASMLRMLLMVTRYWS
jgi:hypothetical protein